MHCSARWMCSALTRRCSGVAMATLVIVRSLPSRARAEAHCSGVHNTDAAHALTLAYGAVHTSMNWTARRMCSALTRRSSGVAMAQ